MVFNAALHKNIMLQILKEIYSDTSLSPYLGFKGGTAAYAVYGLDRFSVDLDFDLLDEARETEVFEKMERIAKGYGKIKESRRKRYSLFFLLSYEAQAQNIKLEINRRSFGSRYAIKNYFGISLQVMVREDMFAHKLMAFYERLGKTNRDIYDVWFFLKHNWPVNKKIVEERSGLPFKTFLQKAVKLLEQLSDRTILSGIGDLLDPKQKIWVKANLRTDAIFLLKLMLSNEK